jgi:sarcosine oxidase subunit gamma
MPAITPQTFKKRSFVYHKLSAKHYTEIAGAAVSIHSVVEPQATVSLCDLSNLPRTGFRGLKAAQHLLSVGLPIPAKPNQAEKSANGELVLRLSQKEFWILANTNCEQSGYSKIDNLLNTTVPKEQCFALYCQDSHAWLLLTGEYLGKIMAKLCGVDLSSEAFPLGSIAQTSAGRINIIVVHHHFNGQPCFSLLCDSAAAEYLWDSLCDAMQEFKGKERGLLALANS